MIINKEELELKKLEKHEVRILVNWAKKEGWNPGASDFEVFWKTDPDGFYGFYFHQQLIAAGAIISYHQKFGFMGLFIVHPNFRGQGIGKKLWYLRRDLLIERLDQGATIGMDGVVEMQPFYEKGGFQIAFKDERYQCIGKTMTIDSAVSSVNKGDFKKLIDYDLSCFGYDRKEFLENWLMIPDSKSFKFMVNEAFMGYAVIRKVDPGFKIGPLFADNDEIAEALFQACLNSAAGASVFLDIPVINQGAVDLVKQYQAKYTFECARMYYGSFPKMAVEKVYGITTFELG